MKIGVPKEIKSFEYRVGMVPSSVRELTLLGHAVFVETNAGIGIGATDEDYERAGATILKTAEEIFAVADMIVKVKEPQAQEWKLLKAHQTIFTYLHLAPDLAQTEGLLASGCTAIAYETVTDRKGRLPLLSPMSAVAGRMSIHVGAHYLERTQGGRGMLLGGVAGVAAAQVVILGGGVAGTNALRMAVGMEADVTVIDKSVERLQELDNQFSSRVNTIYATRDAIEEYVLSADLVIGAVLVPGDTAPKLVDRAMVKQMGPGAVLVDISIDQGGCFETSKVTTHEKPTFLVDGVVHYCVGNMPGAASRTSTFALNNVTLPYIIALANKGPREACLADPHLLAGVNVHRGQITYEAVARVFGKRYIGAGEALR